MSVGHQENPIFESADAGRGGAMLLVLKVCVGVVGAHSVALGAVIYVMPAPFYNLFFAMRPSDPFFVRQAGLFLMCLGFFYLYPLTDIRRLHRLIGLTVATKILAVGFLLSNAALATAPATARLAAGGDALLALLLVIPYALARSRNVV